MSADDHRLARRVLIAVAVGGGAIAVALALWATAQIVLLLFAGVLLAVFLRSSADALVRYSFLSPGWAFAVVVLLFLGLSLGGFIYLVPVAGDAFETLTDQIPKALERISAYAERVPWLGDLLDSGNDEGSVARSVFSRVAGIFSTALGALTGLIIIVAVGIYAGAEPRVYLHGIAELVPPGGRERARQVLGALRHTLMWWTLGRLMSMAVVWLLTWIGLLLLDLPQAMALALLAGLLSFIPNIGPILSAVPAILLGFAQEGIWMAVAVTILYLVVQTIESYFITPMIQRRTVSMPPAMLISLQVLFGTLFGFLGILLATPIGVAATVLIKLLYVEDTLGEKVEID